ncbi:MAG TPA: hypothetical protein VJ180_10150, partial [Pyrinomonadaceae bacterium]|nr:hypothetical protein [Pyrinomonadaceae bacterium]
MRAAAWVLLFLISLLAADGFTSFATSITQKNNSAPTGIKLLTRTTTRREGRRFGYGGTVTVVGAPTGSITVE